ncbi:unnamed protein product [Boreogadus saida]
MIANELFPHERHTAIATSSVKRPTEDSLRWNMPTHQCTVCDQTFGEKSNLARHLKIHAIARETFSCVVCGKSLATKPSLVSHQRLHQYPNIILYRQGEARLYCTEAARSVAEARSSTVVDPKWLDLKTAEAAAKRSGGELWKVLPAGRAERAAEVAEGATAPSATRSSTGTSITRLERDMVRSGGIQEMLNLHPDVDAAMPECAFLLFTFKTAIATSSVKRPTEDSLRWNMPTHQCTVCDQTFGEKSNLARHLKIHAIARETFSCVVCGKSLATKPSLVSHQRLHQYPNIILYRQGEARLYCTEAARSVAEARSSTVVDPKWLDLKTAEAAAKRSGGELWKVLPAGRAERAAEVAEGATAPSATRSSTGTSITRLERDVVRSGGIQEMLNLHPDVDAAMPECAFLLFTFKTAIATSSVKRPTEDSLRWNMPTHQCTVCDQTFGEKSNLARHLKIHAIARETFSCVVCGKSLATKPSLVSHQRLHQYPNIILYRQGEARLYCTEAARSVAEARSSTVVDPKWLDLKTAEAAAKRSGGELWKVLPAGRAERAAEVAEGATAPSATRSSTGTSITRLERDMVRSGGDAEPASRRGRGDA